MKPALDAPHETTLVGFYTDNGFWLAEASDLSAPGALRRLGATIPEVAVSSEGPWGEAKICIDGLILLRIDALAERPDMGDPRLLEESLLWWEEHLAYAHALQLCLASASIQCVASTDIQIAALTPSETCRVRFRNGMALTRVQSRNRATLQARWQALERARGADNARSMMWDQEWETWRTVTQKVLVDGVAAFAALSGDRDRIKRLALIAQAQAAHVRGDFKVAFVLLWFVVESVLKEIAQVAPKTMVAQAIRTLQGADRGLSTELLALADELRAHRNQLMHEPGATVCTPQHCAQAGELALVLALHGQSQSLVMKWQASVEF